MDVMLQSCGLDAQDYVLSQDGPAVRVVVKGDFGIFWDIRARTITLWSCAPPVFLDMLNTILSVFDCSYRVTCHADAEFPGNTLLSLAPRTFRTAPVRTDGALQMFPAIPTCDYLKNGWTPFSARKERFLAFVAGIPLYRWNAPRTAYRPSASFVGSFWDSRQDFVPTKWRFRRCVPTRDVYPYAGGVEDAWGIAVDVDTEMLPAPSLMIGGEARRAKLNQWLTERRSSPIQSVGDILLFREWVWRARYYVFGDELEKDLERFVDWCIGKIFPLSVKCIMM